MLKGVGVILMLLLSQAFT